MTNGDAIMYAKVKKRGIGENEITTHHTYKRHPHYSRDFSYKGQIINMYQQRYPNIAA